MSDALDSGGKVERLPHRQLAHVVVRLRSAVAGSEAILR